MRNAGFYFILLGVSKMTMPTRSILITFIKSCDNIISINTRGLLKVVKVEQLQSWTSYRISVLGYFWASVSLERHTQVETSERKYL